MIQLTRNEAQNVAITSGEILPDNSKRIAIYVTNTGANTITISKGVMPAVYGAGIILNPNGTWFETDSEGFLCWKGRIQVISAPAGVSTIAISETSEV